MGVAYLLDGHVDGGLGEADQVGVLVDAEVLVGLDHIAYLAEEGAHRLVRLFDERIETRQVGVLRVAILLLLLLEIIE